jgi:TonB family protein
MALITSSLTDQMKAEVLKIFSRIIFICWMLVLTGTGTINGFSQAQDSQQAITVVSTTPPKYPPIARAARVEGTVLVEVIIDADGKPISSKTKEGHVLLKQDAEKTALEWKFNPSSREDNWRKVEIAFVYSLKAKDATASENEARFIPPGRFEFIYQYPTIRPLERINGNVPEKTCPLHGDKMLLAIVPVSYGCEIGEIHFRNNNPVNVWRNVRRNWVKRHSYEFARQKYFPESNISVLIGGPGDSDITKTETLYCTKCREAEEKWCHAHSDKCH